MVPVMNPTAKTKPRKVKAVDADALSPEELYRLLSSTFVYLTRKN